jgi:hypothetical protein
VAIDTNQRDLKANVKTKATNPAGYLVT